MNGKRALSSMLGALGCGLITACAMSADPGPAPSLDHDEAIHAGAVAAIPKLTDDGSGCYGACGSGCDFCYGSQVTLPYTCSDGSAGTITKNRLICPTAPCCVEHDGCFRGCGLDLVCQAGCQANAIAEGCAPALVGDPVPGEMWIVQEEDDYITCHGKTTVKRNIPIQVN